MLSGITLSVPPGSCVAFCGVNGSGKSTLLRILAGHLRANKGAYAVGGEIITSLGDEELSRWRYASTGMVSAGSADLIPFASGVANISIGRRRPRDVRSKIAEIITGLGGAISDGLLLKPAYAMSDGQKRFVQYARAIVHGPNVLCIDDPYAHIQREIADIMIETALHRVKIPYVMLAVTSQAEAPPGASHVYLLDKGVLEKP